MNLQIFKYNDTYIIYKASPIDAEYLVGYSVKGTLYIHVKRDTGFILAYIDQDVNKSIMLTRKMQDEVLAFAEAKR